MKKYIEMCACMCKAQRECHPHVATLAVWGLEVEFRDIRHR